MAVRPEERRGWLRIYGLTVGCMVVALQDAVEAGRTGWVVAFIVLMLGAALVLAQLITQADEHGT